jgi:hypothetical protein
MNKPFHSGLGIGRAIRSLAAFAVLFLAVGISQSYAQSAEPLRTTVLSNKQITQSNAPAGVTFLDGTDAVRQLSIAIDAFDATSSNTATSEADAGIRVAYYEMVALSIRNGGGVGDAYNNTAQGLTEIIARYDSSSAPSFNDVRQTTLSLITQ